MNSNYYSKKLSVTSTEQTFDLPRLRTSRVLNYGSAEVTIEFENDVDTDSIVIPVRGDIEIPADMQNIHYKTASGTATLYIYGLRHFKA